MLINQLNNYIPFWLIVKQNGEYNTKLHITAVLPTYPVLCFI